MEEQIKKENNLKKKDDEAKQKIIERQEEEYTKIENESDDTENDSFKKNSLPGEGLGPNGEGARARLLEGLDGQPPERRQHTQLRQEPSRTARTGRPEPFRGRGLQKWQSPPLEGACGRAEPGSDRSEGRRG